MNGFVSPFNDGSVQVFVRVTDGPHPTNKVISNADNNNFNLLVISLLFSLIIIFYYIRIIKLLIFTKYDFSVITLYYPIKYINGLILVTFTYINIFFCLNPSIFFDFFYYQILNLFI